MEEHKTKSGLTVITDSHKDEERPLNCGVCGTSFRLDQMSVYDKHMVKCAKSERADEMEAQSFRRKAAMFDPTVFGDVEMERWVRKHRKAIIDGDMKM